MKIMMNNKKDKEEEEAELQSFDLVYGFRMLRSNKQYSTFQNQVVKRKKFHT